MEFKPKTFHLQWHVTERCNLKCIHCYQDTKFLKEELPLSKLFFILENFIVQIKEWELKKEDVEISITGGEPLARKDIFLLFEQLHKNKKYFNYGVLTNGTFLNKNIVKKLKSFHINYVQISIEGLEKTNDKIRGKGTFKKIIKALKLLKKEGIKTNLSITVTKINLKDVPEIISLSKKLGVGVTIRRCVPQGRGRDMEKFILTPKELKALWRYVFKTNNITKGEKINVGCEDGLLAQDFPEYNPQGCSAGYMSFTVLPNGDVYPCRRLPVFVGNLLRETFKEIYYESETLKKIRDLNNINDLCYQCPFYEKCLGGAKCVSFAYFKNLVAPDPHCWRLFGKLPEKETPWKKQNFSRKEAVNRRWIKF